MNISNKNDSKTESKTNKGTIPGEDPKKEKGELLSDEELDEVVGGTQPPPSEEQPLR